MIKVNFYTHDADIDFTDIEAEFPVCPQIGDNIRFDGFFPYHTEKRKKLIEVLSRNGFVSTGEVIAREWVSVQSKKEPQFVLKLKLLK